MGGVPGAFAKCQNSADAAGLDGTYKAWIVGNGQGPLFSFAHSADLDSYPYHLVDTQSGLGQRVAANWDDLVDGNLEHSINVDEYGNTVNDGTKVWTAVTKEGSPQQDWTCKTPGDPTPKWQYDGSLRKGGFGTVGYLNGKWTYSGVAQCNTMKRLYCFQQDVSYVSLFCQLLSSLHT